MIKSVIIATLIATSISSYAGCGGCGKNAPHHHKKTKITRIQKKAIKSALNGYFNKINTTILSSSLSNTQQKKQKNIQADYQIKLRNLTQEYIRELKKEDLSQTQ